MTNGQFRNVLDRRLSAGDGFLTVYMAGNDCGYPRIGISVAKSCRKAVVRNRLKRLVREAFRQAQQRIPAAYDYVVLVSSAWCTRAAKSATAGQLARRLRLSQVKDSFVKLVTDASAKAD